MSSTSRFRTNSPNYQPPSPQNYDDDEDDLDINTYNAFAPVGGTFVDCFDSYEELRPRDFLLDEEITELLNLATDNSIAHSDIIKKISDYSFDFTNPQSFDELSLDEKEEKLEKFIPFNSILESDHSFKDESSLRMLGSTVKETVRELITTKVFKLDLSRINKECEFLQKEIMQIVTGKRTPFLSIEKTLKVLEDDVQTFLNIFEKGFKKFLKFHEINKELPKYIKSKIEDQDIIECLEFSDQLLCIRYNLARRIRIVYIPSGGGKTTLSTDHPQRYYDVDQLVKDNYELFKKMKKLADRNKNYSNFIMSKFYKFCIANLGTEILSTRILLLNHPNQVPNVMKNRINEMIIFPTICNFRVRFFSENFFSLWFCNRYVKSVLPWKDFDNAIKTYFQFDLI